MFSRDVAAIRGTRVLSRPPLEAVRRASVRFRSPSCTVPAIARLRDALDDAFSPLRSRAVVVKSLHRRTLITSAVCLVRIGPRLSTEKY
jgi:hypothetical protein